MASTRVEWFLAAKKTLRAHGDWSNEQVADYCGVPHSEIGNVIAPARREVEQDQQDPATRVPGRE